MSDFVVGKIQQLLDGKQDKRIAELEADLLSAISWRDGFQKEKEALEKQLAERDAALARFSSILSSVANAVEKEAFRMPAPNEHTPVFVGIANFARNNNCGLPVSAQATAKVLAAARRLAGHIVRPSDFEALREAIREEKEGK